MVMIFFDPHGQATCKRTLAIVKALNARLDTRKKLVYVLSKADDITNEQERAKVLVQLSRT
jgi:hypothetical protein